MTGELLAIYSDGISEAAAPDGRELGVDGLVAILRRRASEPVRTIVEAVQDEVNQYTGGAPASDDRTLVVAKMALD